MKFISYKTENIALKLIFALIVLFMLPLSYALNINSCQTLGTANTYYQLTQNIGSSGTCIIIGADNITLDGTGYTINYSQSTAGYGINNSLGYDNITIKNLNIVSGSTTTYSAIQGNGMSNSTISNNTISTSTSGGYWPDGMTLLSSNSNMISNNTITVSANQAGGFYLDSSSANIISNNTINVSGGANYGIQLWTSDNSNIISNNIITMYAASSYGIDILSSSTSNTFTNNTITILNSDSGIRIYSSDSNIITGGSIIAKQSNDYYLRNAGTTNNFTNTNFTAQRKIYFYDAFSWFNYNNRTNGNIWLKTNSSKQGSINRTLVTWTNSTMKWNDTNGTSALTMSYNLTGLIPNADYIVRNTSAAGTTRQILTADANGNLQSFTIALNGNTEIKAVSTSINSCQDIDEANITYKLIANVSSAGTCFNILANNITLDGQGYTVNYSQSATGYAINNSGYNFTAIKNLNIVQGNASVSDAYAIYGSGMADSTILNNNITTSDDAGYGIYLISSSNLNTISNNNIDTSGISAYGIYLYSSDTNTLSGNNIRASGTDGYGINLQSGSNNITGGSIISRQSYDYFLKTAGGTNNFTNTNFTAKRSIGFNEASSWFNYRNDSSNSFWLATSISLQSSINRTLVNWTRSAMKWNDTNSTAGIIATYNITGLWFGVNYSVYNTSAGTRTNPYNLTADSGGNLPGFNITLNGNTEIFINKTENTAPEIALNSPADMSWSASRTISHQFTPQDDAGFSNCSVWSNSTGSWNLMQTNTSAVVNGGINAISSAYSQDGDFTWGVKCYDNGAPPLSSFSMTNRTVRIDSTPPNITLLSPANSSTWASSLTVLFEYNISDAVSIANCTLLVNGAVSDNSTTVSKDVKQNFTKTLSNGNYNWSVSCYDSLNNNGDSGANNLFVNYTAPPTCSDGIQNQGETGVDCGGPCSACNNNQGGGGDQNLTSLTIRPSWAVTKVYVMFKSPITNPSLNVIRLSNVSVGAPSEPVYQYFSITPTNFEDSDIESASIEFKVDVNWINSNNISAIRLARYADGWNKLDTTYVNSSGGYDSYIVYPGGFSYFAILGELASAPASEPPPSTPPPAPGTPPVTPGNISNGTQGGNLPPKEGGMSWILIAAVSVAVLGGGAYIYYRYKESGGNSAANVPERNPVEESWFRNLGGSLLGGSSDTRRKDDGETDYLVKRMSEVKRNFGAPQNLSKDAEDNYLIERIRDAKRKLTGY